MVRKLVTKARYDGHSSMMEWNGCWSAFDSTASSSASKVIAIANTPSLRASRRPIGSSVSAAIAICRTS